MNRGGIVIVIFDLDGTLYRTHETCLPAFRDICDKYNIPLTKESENFLLYTTTDSFLRRNMPDMTAEQRTEFGTELKWREIAAVKESGRLFDGIYEMLDSLAQDGVEMAICGMGSKEYIEAVLERCGIATYFKVVYHRIEGLTKGEVMRALLSDITLESTQCLMVGDSITVLRRARERDVPKYGEAFLERYINRYIPAQKLYLDEFTPKEKSQLVVDNNDYQKPIAIDCFGRY